MNKFSFKGNICAKTFKKLKSKNIVSFPILKKSVINFFFNKKYTFTIRVGRVWVVISNRNKIIKLYWYTKMNLSQKYILYILNLKYAQLIPIFPQINIHFVFFTCQHK